MVHIGRAISASFSPFPFLHSQLSSSQSKAYAPILSTQTSALYKPFTYLLTYLLPVQTAPLNAVIRNSYESAARHRRHCRSDAERSPHQDVTKCHMCRRRNRRWADICANCTTRETSSRAPLHSFVRSFHAFVLIQAARPIKQHRQSNDIKTYTNVKEAQQL